MMMKNVASKSNLALDTFVVRVKDEHYQNVFEFFRPLDLDDWI